MNKKNIATLVIILALILIVFLVVLQSDKNKACIEDKACFTIEIPQTSEEKQLGLGNRDFLEEDKAMLFIFDEIGIYGFWMKNMNFPLDLIWIKENLDISSISKSLEPCENEEECAAFYPEEEIKYVLEINAGLSETYGFEKEDLVSLK